MPDSRPLLRIQAWLSRRRRTLFALAVTACIGLAHLGAGEEPAAPWRRLEPGLDFGAFPAPRASAIGDSLVRVLRIDPARFRFHLLNASAGGGAPRTARRWCEEAGMVAAINASMYQADHRTSVSLMRTRQHVNNPRLSGDLAVLAFDRLDAAGAAEVTLLDRECDDFASASARYGTLVQSIRMISCRGRNVWSRQQRRWSTAAVAVDGERRVLFLHVRSPFSTHDLIDALRELPLGIERAMYVEGGPEAQLFVRAGGEVLELVGSYETGFNENDDNARAWPVPNVVAISRRGAVPGGE